MIIVYDKYNPDAVIATAILVKISGCRNLATNVEDAEELMYDLPEDDDEICLWVGLDPTRNTLRRIELKHEYVGVKQPTHKKMFEKIFCVDDITHVQEVNKDFLKPLDSCLQALTLLHPEDDNEYHLIGDMWLMASSLSKFNNLEHLSYEEQFSILITAKHAKEYLYSDEERTIKKVRGFNEHGFTINYEEVRKRRVFDVSPPPEKISIAEMRLLKSFLSNIKTRIQNTWHLSKFKIDGVVYEIPILNMEAEVIPWAKKIVSCITPRGVFYYIYKGRLVCTCFSKAGDQTRMEEIILESTDTILLGNSLSTRV